MVVRGTLLAWKRSFEQQDAKGGHTNWDGRGLLLEAHSTAPGHEEVRHQLAAYYAHQVRLHDSTGIRSSRRGCAAQGQTYDREGVHQALFSGKATIHWRGEGTLARVPVRPVRPQ